MEWVEVKGPSVEVAVEAALAELGIESRDDVDVEVLQEPEKGFLGIGRTDAVVRVKPRPKKRRRTRSAKGKGEGKREERSQAGSSRQRGDQRAASGQGRDRAGRSGQGRDQQKKSGQAQQAGSSRRSNPPGKHRTAASPAKVGDGKTSDTQPREKTVSREEQASVVGEFLEGLLGAFGLEGTVETRVDDDIIDADAPGAKPRRCGVAWRDPAVHRRAGQDRRAAKNRGTARVRLDIAAYAERRREH